MILIENELIFLSVPKNASMSVHHALENSTIKFGPTFNYDVLFEAMLKNDKNYLNKFVNIYVNKNYKIKIHPHFTIAEVYSQLNKKLPVIFIKREYCERFLSALNYIFNFRIPFGYPEFKDILHNIDNDWIYKNVNNDVIANIRMYNPGDKWSSEDDVDSVEEFAHRSIINSLNKFIKNKTILEHDKSLPTNRYINFKMLDSQETFKSGYTPKYIFDIGELDKLEKFIYDRYGKTIEIKKINSMTDHTIKTNFVQDTKLQNWVWNNFEKHHFIKKIF